MALAKARLAVLVQGTALVPAAADRVAVFVRTRPWRGVGIALAAGLALGLSRGRGTRALGAFVGTFGAALATGFLRQLAVGPPAESALSAKIAELRARAAER